MTSIAFDTLSSVRRMRDKGVPQEQTEAFADELRVANEVDFSHLTTREEFITFKSELKDDLRNIRSDLNKFATKTDLKAEMTELKAELIKWMLGVSFAQIALILTVLKLVH